MALSAPTTPCETSRSAWMAGRSGPIAMIWGRRTSATTTRAMSVETSDRRSAGWVSTYPRLRRISALMAGRISCRSPMIA